MRKPYINRIHIILEAIGTLFCIVGILVGVALAMRTEGEIPTHFNLAGEVDGYGSPWTLLLLPLIMLGTNLLIAVCLHLVPDGKWSTGFRMKPGREVYVLADYAYMMAALEVALGLYGLLGTLLFTNGIAMAILAGILTTVTLMIIVIFFIKAKQDND